MAQSKLDPALNTRSSIFINLCAEESQARELAWETFHLRYAPIITGFARRFGATREVAEDIVQEVIVGFYAAMPAFVYDRSKGRFRGYLKVCVISAMTRHRRKFKKHADIDAIDPTSIGVDQAWSDVWEQELLRQAMSEAQEEFSADHTYQAFTEYAVLGRPVEEVAAQLGVSKDVVYQAKTRVTKVLQKKMKQHAADYG